MGIIGKFGKACAAMTMAAGLLISTPAVSSDYLQCAPFARAESGVQLFGNAKSWWGQAAGTYARGNEPRQGAVLAFSSTSSMPMGHVAVVRKVLNDREIMIDHANWSPVGGRRGQVERNVRVKDVSAANDWSVVRVWYAPIGDLGLRPNPIQGFIYPETSRADELPSTGRSNGNRAPAWNNDDWKPGNGLDAVISSLR